MGIQFGVSKEEVMTTIKAKHPSAVVYQNNPNSVIYQEIKFAGREATAIIFAFTDDGKLHTCKVMLYADRDIEVFDLYDAVSSELTEIYGKPQYNEEIFKYPYSKSDRGQLTPLKAGYVNIYKMWMFDTYQTVDSDGDDDVISIAIEKAPYVLLVYQSSKIAKEQINRNKSKNANDY